MVDYVDFCLVKHFIKNKRKGFGECSLTHLTYYSEQVAIVSKDKMQTGSNNIIPKCVIWQSLQVTYMKLLLRKRK